MRELKKVILSEELSSKAASELKLSLEKESDSGVELDASNVQLLGAQCLQVMLAASAEWSGKDLAFHIVNASEGFVADLNRLGFSNDDLEYKEMAQ